ncbi:hypothetical protein [Qipengyuania sp.]|uniref:hypothetical protein n=2 Tax=Qipengyuania sp. TaxID=2004515 RepID=UPI00355A683A
MATRRASIKPTDLMFGLQELFSFLIPGAFFLVLMPAEVVDFLLGLIGVEEGDPDLEKLQGVLPFWPADTTAQAILFAFAAYAVGVFLSGIGSLVDWLPDTNVSIKRFIAQLRKDWQEKDDAKIKRYQALEETAEQLKKPYHNKLTAPFRLKSFWWHYLRLKCPTAVTEIDKLEAQQKFFRSLFVAFLILVVIQISLCNWSSAAAFATLNLFSLVAYSTIRQRQTRKIFKFALIHSLISANR